VATAISQIVSPLVETVGADPTIGETGHDAVARNAGWRIAAQGQDWRALLDCPVGRTAIERKRPQASVHGAQQHRIAGDHRRRYHFAAHRPPPPFLAGLRVEQNQMSVRRPQCQDAFPVSRPGRQGQVRAHIPLPAAAFQIKRGHLPVMGRGKQIDAIGSRSQLQAKTFETGSDPRGPQPAHLDNGLHGNQLGRRFGRIRRTATDDRKPATGQSSLTSCSPPGRQVIELQLQQRPVQQFGARLNQCLHVGTARRVVLTQRGMYVAPQLAEARRHMPGFTDPSQRQGLVVFLKVDQNPGQTQACNQRHFPVAGAVHDVAQLAGRPLRIPEAEIHACHQQPALIGIGTARVIITQLGQQ
jgi:hypothetical protein